MSDPTQTQELSIDEMTTVLCDLGLADRGEALAFTRLSGGVSSDIWKIEGAGRSVCIKRALPALRVGADWKAPIERYLSEIEWLQVVGQLVPQACPRMLGVDKKRQLFVMEYLDPRDNHLWKDRLRDGTAEPSFAAAVGSLLGRIHAATAGRADIAARFSTGRIFEAIRLEPYLRATGRVHVELSRYLNELADLTASPERALALVHGDVSPKNILVGANGPVFIDAECAWYGDPAFDAAFCLNHLLLKCIWMPGSTPLYLQSFDCLWQGYIKNVSWESQRSISDRVAKLLPALLLARIDGKSPVEYIVEETEKNLVRRIARGMLVDPVHAVEEIRNIWAKEIGVA